MVSKLLLWGALLNTICNADKIFVTYPVTGGTPAVAGKPLEIQWEPVTDSSGPPFPSKIGIDLMQGDDNAASKAMTIVGKEVDPRAGSYKWERVPKDLDPNPPGGGYFLRLGSVQDGYFYGSRFQIKGATGESDPDKKSSGSDKNDKPKDDKDKDKDSKPSSSSSSSRRAFGNKPKEQTGSEVRAASTTRTPKTSTSSGESFKNVGGLSSAVFLVSSSAVVAYMLV